MIWHSDDGETEQHDTSTQLVLQRQEDAACLAAVWELPVLVDTGVSGWPWA